MVYDIYNIYIYAQILKEDRYGKIWKKYCTHIGS